MSEWFPIKTAPKDGRHVVLYFGPDAKCPAAEPRCVIAYWDDDPGNPLEGEPPCAWWWDDGYTGLCEDGSQPTHWLPLPPRPKSES